MKVYDLQRALKDRGKVTELYLHNRGIGDFPMEVFALINLKKLDLSQNNIQTIPPEIASLDSLESLVLSGNKIKSLPDELSKLNGLSELDLKNNPLSEIPKVIFKLKNLKTLNLSNTKIDKLDAEIKNIAGLENLDVSGNNISKLSKKLGKLTALTKLFLQKNKLNRLPNELVNCVQLNTLDVSNNRLKRLSEFKDLSRLELLIAHHNRLDSLPESIGNCAFLKTLDVGFNKISSLPNRISRLKYLRVLDCSKNRITQLPGNIGNCISLRRLYFNKNLLTELPESMDKFHSLENLDVSENQLTALPNFFQSMTRLKMLELKKNNLNALPDSLKLRKSLKYLGLMGNPIVITPEELLNLENIEKLNGRIGIEPPVKRKLIQFLKSCKKRQISEEFRMSFYELLNGKSPKTTLDILLKALSFPNQTIRANALKSIIESYSQSKKMQKGHILAFVGKRHFNLEEIAPILLKAGISIKSVLSEKVTHVVLGFNPLQHELLTKKKYTFFSERDLNNFIKTIHNSKELSNLEVEKIRDLLTSTRPENNEIALQILKGTNIQKSILTELFIAYKFSENKKQKAKLRSILVLNLSEKALKLLRLPLGIFKTIDQRRLEGAIKKLVEAGFNGEKITQFVNRKVYF
jgi:Leucine-rich repeat (LRR) protein